MSGGVYKLWYLDGRAVVRQTPNGLYEVDGLEDYRDAKLRNKVVLRIDLISSLRDVFSEDTLNRYRGIIYNSIAGNFPEEKISTVMQGLFEIDEVFQTYLGNLYYFEFPGKTCSFWDLILNSLLEKLRVSDDKLISALRPQRVKVIYHSSGYVYISIDDSNNFELSVPEAYKVERVSYAKVWSGKICRD